MNEENGSVSEAFEHFLKLLLAFNALPHTKRSRTFMEVSGYPHYENVCSNILGFYFDTTAEHGLQGLLISAFLRMAGEESVISGVVTVSREHHTGKGRIDLIVESELFIIAIENKIYHWLANDLDDYADTIHARSMEKRTVIKAVLGLSPILDCKSLRGGFVSYTYGQLWQEVRNLLGGYIAKANQKWVTYLLDFMETTTNLAGENMEIKQTDQFFIDHADGIEAMLAERNAFLGRLSRTIATLADMMKDTTEARALATPPYPYSKDRLVLDFEDLGGSYNISFDLYLTPAGWDLQLFARDNSSHNFLVSLVKHPVLREKMHSVSVEGKTYHVQRWEVQTDLSEIRNALCRWLVAVSTAANTISGQGTS